MAKLVKQMYITSKGERKLNCYMIAIPKVIVENSDIKDDDEIAVYNEYGQIVISQKYHCTCNECYFEWDSGKDYNIHTCCPRCHMADISFSINGE